MLSAYLALERLLAGMEVLMLRRVRTDRESFIAYLAFVLSVTLMGFDVHFEVILRTAGVFTHEAMVFRICAVLFRMQTES